MAIETAKCWWADIMPAQDSNQKPCQDRKPGQQDVPPPAFLLKMLEPGKCADVNMISGFAQANCSRAG